MPICGVPSICGVNNPSPTPGGRDHCVEAMNDPVCAPDYQVALACVQQHQACSTDGRGDLGATDAACASVIAAMFANATCLAILDQVPGDAGADTAVLDASGPYESGPFL